MRRYLLKMPVLTWVLGLNYAPVNMQLPCPLKPELKRLIETAGSEYSAGIL